MDIIEDILKLVNDKQDAIDHLFDAFSKNGDIVNDIAYACTNNTIFQFKGNNPKLTLKSTGVFCAIKAFDSNPKSNFIMTVNDAPFWRSTLNDPIRIHLQIGGKRKAMKPKDLQLFVPGTFNDYETNSIIDAFVDAMLEIKNV